MAIRDSEKERRQFEDNYRGKTNGELEELAKEARDLTDTARAALGQEMTNRGLIGLAAEQADSPAGEPAWRDPVILGRFADGRAAELARNTLDAGGIRSFLSNENAAQLPWTFSDDSSEIEVWVNAEDAEAAAALLQGERDRLALAEEEDREARCPQCQSTDIMFQEAEDIEETSGEVGSTEQLERLAAMGRWKCYACGHEWKERGDETPAL